MASPQKYNPEIVGRHIQTFKTVTEFSFGSDKNSDPRKKSPYKQRVSGVVVLSKHRHKIFENNVP